MDEEEEERKEEGGNLMTNPEVSANKKGFDDHNGHIWRFSQWTL